MCHFSPRITTQVYICYCMHLYNVPILIDYYAGSHGISGKYLCLAILTNNEACHFSRSTTCLGQTGVTSVMIMCI